MCVCVCVCVFIRVYVAIVCVYVSVYVVCVYVQECVCSVLSVCVYTQAYHSCCCYAFLLHNYIVNGGSLPRIGASIVAVSTNLSGIRYLLRPTR